MNKLNIVTNLPDLGPFAGDWIAALLALKDIVSLDFSISNSFDFNKCLTSSDCKKHVKK